MAVHQTKDIRVSGHLADKNGVWYIKLSWTDENGNRQRKSISTKLLVKGNKKHAEDMLREAKLDQNAYLKSKPRMDRLYFADLMEMWLKHIRDDKKRPIKPTTFGGYQMNVERNIAPYFRRKRILLAELTPDDINKYYDHERERVKAVTVLKFHANIISALKHALEQDYLEDFPLAKIKRPKPERYVGKFLRESEIVELFEVAKGNKLELAVILGAFYGLRRSEVVGLRWESINFETNTITIEHTVVETKIDGKRVLIAGDTTKTKSSYRTLPLVPSIRAKLLEVQVEQEKNRKLCGKSYNKADIGYVYTDVMGNRIKPHYVTSEFPKFLEKHGMRRVRFHDLRHSCASLLLANGVSLKQIQEWLGHSDFAITANIYAHLDFDSKLESAAAMSWIDDTTVGQHFGNSQKTSKRCGARP